jgi:hypothetical protein
MDPVGPLSDPHPNKLDDTIESPTTSDASFNHALELTKLYRKLDLRIIPCLWVLYFLASSSRSTVGLALTMNTNTNDGLSQVLGLSEHEISTGVALFYVAYVIFEVPSNLVSAFPRPPSPSASLSLSLPPRRALVAVDGDPGN